MPAVQGGFILKSQCGPKLNDGVFLTMLGLLFASTSRVHHVRMLVF